MSASNSNPGQKIGAKGQMTRQVLVALRAPGTVAAMMSELGLTRADAWGTIKHLQEQGRVERLQRGVYRITPAGEEALLDRPDSGERYLPMTRIEPPEGKGRTPERQAWLERHYAKLGHRKCGEFLKMEEHAVWAWARDLGLKFGDVNGYILLTDLSELLGLCYTNIYTRAERAGVLTFPGSTKGQERRAKAMVPETWADQISSERQPPTPDDVAVADLRASLGLSKTQAARVAGQDAYLRTPVAGGQPRLYVSVAAADRIKQRYSEKRRKAQPVVVGRPRILAEIVAGGAEGRSERELYEGLPSSRAAIRVHVHAMYLAGLLERCRLGDTLDPFVYRDIKHVGAPQPAQRVVVRGGRPPSTPAVMGLTLEQVQEIRDALPAPSAGELRQRRRRGLIPGLASQYGVKISVIHRILYSMQHAEASD